VNGPDCQQDESLIRGLEELLSIAIPHIETVAAYAVYHRWKSMDSDREMGNGVIVNTMTVCKRLARSVIKLL